MVKNQICTKFATLCQSGDAAFASHLLWCKYWCKLDQQLKTHIFAIWKLLYLMPWLESKIASSVVKY